jgi:hypothetical protein
MTINQAEILLRALEFTKRYLPTTEEQQAEIEELEQLETKQIEENLKNTDETFKNIFSQDDVEKERKLFIKFLNETDFDVVDKKQVKKEQAEVYKDIQTPSILIYNAF